MKLQQIKVTTYEIPSTIGGGYTWVGRNEKVLITVIKTTEKEKN